MKYDVSKLPIWAQDRIRVLEASYADLEDKLDALGVDAEKSRIVWVDGRTHRGIRDYGTIRFRIGEIVDDFEYVDVNLHERKLMIYGARPIRILPHASNAVEIAIDDKRIGL